MGNLVRVISVRNCAVDNARWPVAVGGGGASWRVIKVDISETFIRKLSHRRREVRAEEGRGKNTQRPLAMRGR